jgi:hypothetical protein
MSPARGEVDPIASSRWRRSGKLVGLGFERSNSRTASISLLDMCTSGLAQTFSANWLSSRPDEAHLARGALSFV